MTAVRSFQHQVSASRRPAHLLLRQDGLEVQGDRREARARLGVSPRHLPGFTNYLRPQGCSTLWNGQDFKQVIDARQSGAVAVLAEGAGLA